MATNFALLAAPQNAPPIDFNALQVSPQTPNRLQAPANAPAPTSPGGQLDDASRAKLDSVVQKMTANNESDSDIHAVVADFKQKYGGGVMQSPAASPDYSGGQPTQLQVEAGKAKMRNAVSSIPQAFAHAGGEIVGGVEQAATSGDVNRPLPEQTQNLAQFLGGVKRSAMGIGESLAAPFAPLNEPTGEILNKGIQPIANTYGDLPQVQKFAQSPAGDITQDIAQNVADYSGLLGSIAGVQDPARLKSEIGDMAAAPGNAIKDAASAKRITQFEKVFNMSKGLSAGEVRYGKDSPAFAAQLEKEGVDFTFGRDERGRLNTEDAQANVSAVAKRDNATLSQLLKSSGGYTNFDDVMAKWAAAVQDEFKGTEQNQALSHAADEASAYKEQYADRGVTNTNGQLMLPDDVINEIKQDLWNKSKFKPFAAPTDEMRAGTKFLGGNAIKTAIEESVGGDNLVGRFNQRLGDIAQLQKVLEKAQGGVPHGGFMSRLFGRVIGGIAGSGGGPAGTIIGAITGDMITDALNNPNRPLSWVRTVLNRAEKENPALLKEVEARLGKNAADIEARPRLPAPSTIPLGQEAPRPSTVTSEAAKKFSYQEPGTGKFARGYYSSSDAPKYPEQSPALTPESIFGQTAAPETPTPQPTPAPPPIPEVPPPTVPAPESMLSFLKNNIGNDQRGMLGFGGLSKSQIAAVKAEIAAGQKQLNEATRAKAPTGQIAQIQRRIKGLRMLLR